jgi:hypothetical protein
MKALFNGVCDGCNKFMPRCAVIHIKPSWPNRVKTQTRCEACRRAIRGSYNLDKRHRKAT